MDNNIIDAKNPYKGESKDWYDEMCKKYKAKNYWKKEKPQKKNKITKEKD